jgi:hypothetical protein
MDSSIN